MIQISPASPIDFDIYVIFSPIFPLYFIRRMHLSSNPRRFHIYVLKLTKKKSMISYLFFFQLMSTCEIILCWHFIYCKKSHLDIYRTILYIIISHSDITILHVDILVLHVDISYLGCRNEEYVTIISVLILG